MLSIKEAFPTRVASVIRIDDPELAFRASMAAHEGGIGTLEVTSTVPSCFDIIRGLVASTNGAPVGLGTVWDPGAVAQAARAGASFVVTPVVLPEIADACRKHDILCVMGALTPTEVYQARVSGANLVKLFPISSVGGADYVRNLRGPLGDVPFWVSGGVQIEDICGYVDAGVLAVGLTNAVFPLRALATRDFDTIRERARRAVLAAELSHPDEAPPLEQAV
ncbi:MAG TPA: 2-dehydro-3-deoxyphosphogluconate aldolase [Candidatus Dormibacteraeota bacterium]|jgi:2-dehydro-3-deoxyphosphogluconate aldolase/(4S)-4-hydroxy-2-oxoglutarate aldolase|nr:2-dehydro-3-deoxyphosphogluconate aldolase [Candidatus Dormibacteraeota bacterium]